MRSLILATALFASTAATAAPLAYPTAPRGDVVDVNHGISVPDPYRWLEGDVRTTPAVRAWVDQENAVTQSYLATLPKRDQIKARLTQFWDFEKFQVPIQAGGRVFYRRNAGLQNQYTLMVQDGLTGSARVLIDPNPWSKDGATALAEWQPSKDGRYVAYTVQDGGTDWRTIKVIEAATGRILPETLDWAKFTSIAWDGKGEGFFYARYPATPGGKDYTSAVFDHMIYYHRVGTEQSADKLIFRTPEHTNYYNAVQSTADGRWLVIFSSRGSDNRVAVHAVDLARPKWTVQTLVEEPDNDWRLAGGRGTRLFFVTDRGAPRGRIVALDFANIGTVYEVVPHPAGARDPGEVARHTAFYVPPTGPAEEIVPEGPGRIDEAALVGDRVVTSTLVDAKSVLTTYPLGGGAGTTIALPGIGNATGLDETRADERGMFYAFTSFAVPATIYRYDVSTRDNAVFRQPKAPFDPAAYETRQVFYTSKDGTRVPMFITRKRGTTGAQPTILYGYGGFDISLPPRFSPATVAWMEMGGTYAQANIRGGGEYGVAWHEAGKLFKKQNVFSDFIAAGEYLKANGVTPPGGLAIEGGSNGGLLVGAVTNQRPDLFAAALPAVGVMDMTRFHLFTEGRTWTDDYGDPADPAALKYNLTYSPYHNIRPGQSYPAILATTADTDDRVVPGHSFKYVAKLQAASIGDKPHLIRVETRAGHGSGKPTAKQIEEVADLWAFAGYWTGLTTADGK